MRSTGITWITFFLVAVAAGCSGHTTIDASAADVVADATDVVADISPDVVASTCHVDHDCADDFFCNGVERCMPGAPGANARGCLPGVSPCATGQTCDEGMARCISVCSVAEDADGDGHRAIACGGDDCDDGDANRFPGNAEVCDAHSHDEDCDPATFGNQDADGDGFVATMCCNMVTGGTPNCGTDCDDSNPNVHPGVPEVCNMIDDNCNGMTDEMVIALVYLDSDGDGFGDPGHTAMGCMAGIIGGATYVTNSTDCDDSNAGVHPGATEICDGRNTDCDPTTFGPGEDDDGDHIADITCGGTDCDDTDANVHPGATEICDGKDSDCSSGTLAAPLEDADGDMHSLPGAPCGGGGYPKDDCDDARAVVIPGFTECTSGTAYRTCVAGAWVAGACSGATPSCDNNSATCVAAGSACGDGALQPPEACDDHNLVNLDGCDDRCRIEPGALRPIEPYSDSAVLSTTPLFRVTTSTGAPASTSFEVQRAATRAFTTPTAVPLGAATVAAGNMTATPSIALPVGRYWWRARAVAASGAVGAWSVGWQVRVGRARGDLTGDGNADWVVGEPYYAMGSVPYARVRVFGTNSGAGSSIVPAVNGTELGFWLGEGDINGDGIDDLAIGNPLSGGSVIGQHGEVDVYYGGAGGTTFDTTQDYALMPAALTGHPRLGQHVAVVGDVNGDGFDDIVAGQGQNDDPTLATNSAFLYFGSAMAPSPAPVPIVLNHADSSISVWAIAGGDVNGDGLSDIILTGNVSSSGIVPVRGRISVIFGNTSSPFNTTVGATLQGPATGANRAGQDVTAADITRDGYADIIVGATYTAALFPPPPGRPTTFPTMATDVYAYLGAPAPHTVPDASYTGWATAFGWSVDAGVDLNRDGYLDFMVGAPAMTAAGRVQAGRVYAFAGGATLVSSMAMWFFDGPTANDHLGYDVAVRGQATIGGVSQVLAEIGVPDFDYTFTPPCRITPCPAPVTYTNGGLAYVIRTDGLPALGTPPVSHVVYGGNNDANAGIGLAH